MATKSKDPGDRREAEQAVQSAREQRDRRKAQKALQSARRGQNDRRWIIIGVVAVVLVAAGVTGAVLYQQHVNNEAFQGAIPLSHVPGGTSTTTVDKAAATVTVGKDSAKVTVDAYEDFLCPICGQFEQAYFPGIEKHLTAGDVKIRYHLINLLDASSVPPGYSLIAANTALAVATVAPDKFLDFHYSLYQKQPSENGAGWTQDQLDNLAGRLGVSGAQYDDLIKNKTYDAQIQKNLATAKADKSLYQQNQDGSLSFGTPTITIGGKVVDLNQQDWLDQAVAAAK
jgi:protein-disulfide isomerase